MQLLNNAPWAAWSSSTAPATGAASHVVVTQGSEAMKKAEDGLEAVKKASDDTKALYKQCQDTPALANRYTNPSNLLKGCMNKAKEMGEEWMKPKNEDGVCVKDVKELLLGAAPVMAVVNRSMHEIKALIRSHGVVVKQESKAQEGIQEW